jgi:hypothetical protein
VIGLRSARNGTGAKLLDHAEKAALAARRTHGPDGESADRAIINVTVIPVRPTLSERSSIKLLHLNGARLPRAARAITTNDEPIPGLDPDKRAPKHFHWRIES